MGEEATLSSRRVYDGHIVDLRVDTVQLENGRITEREIVEHRGSVAIVPLDDQGNVLLVRQFRKAIRGELLEIPAGTLESGEEADFCAQRELQEETGYQAGHMERVGGFFPSPGFCTEHIALYLATNLQPSQRATEADEAIEVIKVPLAKAVEMVEGGQICDAKSIIGLLTVAARGRYWERSELI